MIKSQFSSVVVISCMFEIYRLAPPMDQKCKWEMVGKQSYVARQEDCHFKYHLPVQFWCCNSPLLSLQEMPQEQIDTSSAYILFYERRDLNSGSFMPDIKGHEPDTTDNSDEFESEFKKMCTLQ